MYFFPFDVFKEKFYERQVVFMKNMKVFVLSVVGVLLLCSVASAIEVTPYFKISREYAKNPFKAQKEWVKKEICIEGEIVNMNTTDDGDAAVVLSDGNDGKDIDATYNVVVYYFYFNGVPDDVMSLDEGQWIKLSGRILRLRRYNEDWMNALLIDVGHARIVN